MDGWMDRPSSVMTFLGTIIFQSNLIWPRKRGKRDDKDSRVEISELGMLIILDSSDKNAKDLSSYATFGILFQRAVEKHTSGGK